MKVKSQNKSNSPAFTDVAADFARAAGALYAHPSCPAGIRNALVELDSEAYNLAQSANRSREQDGERFASMLNVALVASVKR